MRQGERRQRGLEFHSNIFTHECTYWSDNIMWETVVPDAAPKYSTLEPGFIWVLSTPPKMAAASLLLKGFHTRYSVLPSSPSFCNNRDKHNNVG